MRYIDCNPCECQTKCSDRKNGWEERDPAKSLLATSPGLHRARDGVQVGILFCCESSPSAILLSQVLGFAALHSSLDWTLIALRAADASGPGYGIENSADSDAGPAASCRTLQPRLLEIRNLPHRRTRYETHRSSGQAPPQNAPLNIVVLDPAHGGTDPGARGTGGLRESDVVLGFAAQTRKALEALGFQVIQTRQGDENPSFDDRSALANAQHAALFVSLHIAFLPERQEQRAFMMTEMAAKKRLGSSFRGTLRRRHLFR